MVDWVGADGVWAHIGFPVSFDAGVLDPTLVNASHPLAGDPDMAFLEAGGVRPIGTLPAA